LPPQVRSELEAAQPGMRVAPLSSPVASMQFKAFRGLPPCPEIDELLPAAAK
jgi:hypothetical protein